MRFELKFEGRFWRTNNGLTFCAGVMSELGLSQESRYILSVSTQPVSGYFKLNLWTEGSLSKVWNWEFPGICITDNDANVFIGSEPDKLISALFYGKTKAVLYIHFQKIP